uniref:(California timema) hypothetical protein n=1 Tax=Timema californicum TaxID=61474 RepID=A0A7R9JJC2_TIMCA|nr:unnamed protein product [Timema californicum]
MSVATLSSGPVGLARQGTEDATKWNECLSPSLFALMHKYFFDDDTRTRMCLPLANEYGKLFSKIACTGNFLMSMKEIQLRQGAIIFNDHERGRLQWKKEWIYKMNNYTKSWFEEALPKIDREG